MAKRGSYPLAEATFRSLSSLLMAVSLVAGCGRSDTNVPRSDVSGDRLAPSAGSVSAPLKTRFQAQIQVTGTLKPQRSAQLAMPVSGTLGNVLVQRGQTVKAGTPLATLDASAARAALAQAEANVLAARTQLGLGEDALARHTAMREAGAATETQLVQAKGQRELASAQLQAAIAQREQARVLMSNHTLVAPFSGTIIRAPDSKGIAVGPQVTLFVIEDVDTLVLETSVTQEEAAELQPNANVSVTVPATGMAVHDAVLKLVLPSVDPSNNRVPIDVSVPNAKRTLLAHSFVRAELPSLVDRDAYRVPQAALAQANGSFSVWVATHEGKADAIRVRVLSQADGEFALVDPGPDGFPTGVRIINVPPLGIAVGQSFSVALTP